MKRRTIYKYPMPEYYSLISLDPLGKVILVDMQNEVPTMWVELDPDAKGVSREFAIIGTGREVPDDAQHRGSFQDGVFVWHLYERGLQ